MLQKDVGKEPALGLCLATPSLERPAWLHHCQYSVDWRRGSSSGGPSLSFTRIATQRGGRRVGVGAMCRNLICRGFILDCLIFLLFYKLYLFVCYC